MAVLSKTPLDEKPCYQREFIPRIPPFLPRLALSVVFLIYCWDLGKDNRWQGGDSIQPGMYALRLIQHWDWHLFETFGQTPSTGSYLCWFFLRITHSPFLGYQIPSILLTFLMVILGYLVARLFLPPSFSFIFLLLLALNRWSLELTQTLIALPLWECGLFFCCSKYCLSRTQRRADFWSAAAGAVLGLGYLSFPSWPILVPFVLWVLWKSQKSCFQSPRTLILFSLFLFLALIPFLSVVIREGYGEHISRIGIWNNFSFPYFISVSFRYLTAIFWDVGGDNPFNGGFLNVISASLFFLGAVELYRFRKEPLAFLTTSAFFLFLMPGLLSNSVDLNRILLILPILALVSSIGVQSLLFRCSSRYRILLFILLLSLACGTAVGRYLVSLSKIGHDEKSRSYQILNSFSSQKGPGFVFSDFLPNNTDYSLTYYTYPFNAAINPAIPAGSASWAAVFTESHYVPFLAKRFHSSRWIAFPTTMPGVIDKNMLGVVSITPSEVHLFNRWKNFYEAFQKINFQIMDTPNGRSRKKILEILLNLYPSVPKDPFLQSCFFEKLLFNYSWEKTFYPHNGEPDWPVFSGTFRRSFDLGYQDLELCEKYGRLLATEGRKSEAAHVFKEALALSPGNLWLRAEVLQLGLSL